MYKLMTGTKNDVCFKMVEMMVNATKSTYFSKWAKKTSEIG